MMVDSGSIAQGRHVVDYRVYYEDTDAGGIVYHANYLRFAERARTELLRLLGFEQRQLAAETGVVFVVRRAEVEYFKAIRLDDVVSVESSLQGMGRTSMTLHQKLRVGGEVMASIVVVLVCVGREFRPVRVPDTIASAFQQIIE